MFTPPPGAAVATRSVTGPSIGLGYGGVVDEVMEDNCTMRPCATDFSIAAIMSRHGRAPRARCRERDPPDSISPLGKIIHIHPRRKLRAPVAIT